MNNWFSISKIDDYTFSINEDKHFENVHSYLLIGSNKALLIDSGLGISNINDVVLKLTDLPLLIATTHVHWDHIGGHKYFKNIAVYDLEQDWLFNFPLSLDIVKKNILKNLCVFPRDFDIENYEIFKGKANVILRDGDVIDLGNRFIKVIHTPGHSPGHICFYELENKYLYTGDLVYMGTLDMFYPTTNPIDFKNSIEKIRKLDVKRILPGHYDLNVPLSIVDEIAFELKNLDDKNLLKWGSGIYKYKNFSIHL